MLDLTPSEMSIGGVYIPPALVSGVLGFAAAWALAKIFNRTRLSRFFWNPPLVFLAIWALMSALSSLCLLAP